MNKETSVLIIVLAVIGAITVVGALSIWLMHGVMMGGGFWFLGLVLIQECKS
jgi:hypothetical protein